MMATGYILPHLSQIDFPILINRTNFSVVGWHFSYFIQKLTYSKFLRKQQRQDQTT